jgi:hypothetical protein
MSESVNIDRKQGDPLEFRIDLKWSLWSADIEHFEEYAPETLKHLRAGFAGDFAEYGDYVVITTAPRKEIRYGKVTIDPKTDRVTVTFRAEWDDDQEEQGVWESDEFELPETLEEFMKLVDDAEARLIEKERESA